MTQRRNPTPAEIRERCLEIQEEWSEVQRERRLRADWRKTYPPLEPTSITRSESDESTR